MNKLYIAALLQLTLTISSTYASTTNDNNPQQIKIGVPSISMPDNTGADIATPGAPDSSLSVATQDSMQQPPRPATTQNVEPKDMMTAEQYTAHKAELEKQIEQILATYPATYKARPNSFRIHTITATNPDTGDSIVDIKNVTFHRNFKPAQAFNPETFNQACAVQWKTKTGTMNGYVSSVAEKNGREWDITLVALTKDHPMHNTFPDAKITMPEKKQQVNITVSPLSKEEIRKQLRMQFFGPESAPRNKHKRNH
jgi:hypothetical protein